MAQVAREILRQGVEAKKHIDQSGKNALQSIAQLNLTGGPKDLSKNLDYYLYGTPKKF